MIKSDRRFVIYCNRLVAISDIDDDYNDQQSLFETDLDSSMFKTADIELNTTSD